MFCGKRFFTDQPVSWPASQEAVVSTGLSSPAPPKATAACLDTCRLQLVRKNAFQITAFVSASPALLARLPLLSHAHLALLQFHPMEKAVGPGWEVVGVEPGLALCSFTPEPCCYVVGTGFSASLKQWEVLF